MRLNNGEISKIWHRLRRNETTRLPSRFIVVDTETRTRHIDALQQEHSLRLGCAIYFDLPRGRKKIEHRETVAFTTPGEFWSFVDRHTIPRTRTILSAHNMAFDIMVLDGIRELRRLGWEIDYPICSGLRFLTTARRDHATLLIVDTLNYCPTTLQELGNSLGIPKLEMPSMRASDKRWYEYCARDVEIIEVFWREMISFLRNNDCGSFAPTAAGLALKTYRHRFMGDEIVIHSDPIATDLERRSLYGGRNECYRIGVLPEDEYYLLDVNSLYPEMMRTEIMPRLLLRTGRECSLDKLDEMLDTKFVIARVAIDTDAPIYPLRVDKHLLFPVGRFRTTLAGVELEHARRFDRIRQVFAYAVYNRANLFGDYVWEIYRLRQQYQESGNAAFALFCKMLLNSLYGKFAQRGRIRREVQHRTGVKFGSERMYSESLGSEVWVTYWDGRAYVEEERGEAFDSFPAISAGIAAAARIAMWYLMNIAGRENVCYVDTDSLIVNRQGYRNLTHEIDDARIGALKLVRRCHHVELWGKKDYRLDNLVKTKGIKRTATRLDGGIFEQDRFQTFREAIRQGRTKNVVCVREHKKLARDYDAGLVGEDGSVTPISFNDF